MRQLLPQEKLRIKQVLDHLFDSEVNLDLTEIKEMFFAYMNVNNYDTNMQYSFYERCDYICEMVNNNNVNEDLFSYLYKRDNSTDLDNLFNSITYIPRPKNDDDLLAMRARQNVEEAEFRYEKDYPEKDYERDYINNNEID